MATNVFPVARAIDVAAHARVKRIPGLIRFGSSPTPTLPAGGREKRVVRFPTGWKRGLSLRAWGTGGARGGEG